MQRSIKTKRNRIPHPIWGLPVQPLLHIFEDCVNTVAGGGNLVSASTAPWTDHKGRHFQNFFEHRRGKRIELTITENPAMVSPLV